MGRYLTPALTSGFGLFDTSLTQLARQYLGSDYIVDKDSVLYTGGEVSGHLWGIFATPIAPLNADSKTVLYSGRGTLQAGKGAGKIISETLGGKLLNYAEDFIIRQSGKELHPKVWDVASGIFAENAKGKIQIFLRNP